MWARQFRPDDVFPLGIQVGDPNPSLGFAETDHQNVINLYGPDLQASILVQTISGAVIPTVPDSKYGDELKYMGVEKGRGRVFCVHNTGL
ncbi:MAG: hypothetical protein R2778_12715 [Saprospiraceae bacterium]